MCKQILVFLGISIAIGCGESTKENQFSSGCSEGGGYSGGSSATSGDKDGGEGGSSGDDDVGGDGSSDGSNQVSSWSGTKQIGTSLSDQGNGIATDSNGNVYVTGTTQGSLDGNTSAGEGDLFVVKYNSSGAKQLCLTVPKLQFWNECRTRRLASPMPYVLPRQNLPHCVR